MAVREVPAAGQIHGENRIAVFKRGQIHGRFNERTDRPAGVQCPVKAIVLRLSTAGNGQHSVAQVRVGLLECLRPEVGGDAGERHADNTLWHQRRLGRAFRPKGRMPVAEAPGCGQTVVVLPWRCAG